MSTSIECRNCGASLSGAYCSACGQAADVRIPSLWTLIVDALGDLYSFDSRLWRSLIALCLLPGRLTLRYLQGQRARHVPPFRMYLVSSLVFFLLVSFGGDDEPTPEPPADAAATPDAAAAAPLDLFMAMRHVYGQGRLVTGDSQYRTGPLRRSGR